MGIPIVSDLLGALGLGDLGAMLGLGPNPGMKGMTKALEDAKKDYAAYRPEMWAARMGALQKTMDLFQPVNNKMEELYGSDAVPSLDAAFQYDRRTPSPSGAPSGAQQPWLAPLQPGKRSY